MNAKTPDNAHGYPINPVPFTSVKVTDAFWGQRLKASREVTIPLAFRKCEETGRYTNFVRAAHPSDTIKVGGLSFDDTDVYKTIEGASYILQTYPDKKLESYIDSVLEIVAAAQEPDGYLYTSRTMNPAHPHEWAGSRRWEAVENLSHEFYNLGHMVEGAIAHYQATGKRNFLDIAVRYADCVCREIGDKDGQTVRVPGHQIAEMALARLYLVTGNKKYLDQAKFFLDKRGHTSRTDKYSQAHKPVTKQDEAVGHAVRAAYMYAGMADVAALTGDSAYIRAIDNIWNNIVSKKYYITGGIGAKHEGEAFGKNYELPNMSAYCETCAAIGNVYVNHRLFLLHGDSKYYDVLERTLYNGLISGVSIDGGGFFYPNPLESHGQHRRQPWFGCACCPSNICRFIPSVPGYIYAVKDRNVYINLFISNASDIKVGGKDVALTQTTDYPWNGDVTMTVDKNKAGHFDMRIRIPGWVRGEAVPSDLYRYSDGKHLGYTVCVNGNPVKAELEKGYLSIARKWKKGDKVEIHFDMEPRTVRAHSDVEADRGRVAFERGPIVYCAEWADNDFDVLSVLVNQNPQIHTAYCPDVLNGLTKLVTDVRTPSLDGSGSPTGNKARLTLIPYYAWCHRGPGNMAVWLPQEQAPARQKNIFTVDPSRPHQQIDCFGASDAWSMRFIGEMSQNTQSHVARLLFSSETDSQGNPMGIGLSLWRFNIGAGSAEQGDGSLINYGTRTECFQDSNGTYNWNKQKGQRSFLKLAKNHGVPYLLGFLNSPPVHYTKNGLATNTGRGGTYNLREDKYEEFAGFLADVISGLEAHDGVKFDYLSPVNEPDGHWNWQGPKQEGTPATKYEIARLSRVIDKELQSRGISTRMIIPESSDYRCMMSTHETGPERGYEIQSFFSKDSAETYIGNLKSIPRLMAGHSYWTNTPVEYMKECRKALRDTLRKYNVELWQSEVCIMGNDEEIGGGGGYDRTMKTALYVARMIHHDLVFADARSWQWWRAVGGNYKDGLLFQYKAPGSANDTIVDSKLLWTLGNYSRFIRPGALRIEVKRSCPDLQPDPDAATQPYGLMCSAFRNRDGSTVIVMINYSYEDETAGFNIPNKAEWKVYRTSDKAGESLKFIEKRNNISNVAFPARSVTTLVCGNNQ
ncbi:beta-L-arabinofuranosidase domain-containing protein [Xylanibacter muris]